MFRFLEYDSYKKLFRIVVVMLIVAFFAFSTVTAVLLWHNNINTAEQAAHQYFDYTEQRLQLVMKKIDSYYLHIYSDDRLAADLYYFCGKRPQEYLLARTENGDRLSTASILTDMETFLLTGCPEVTEIYCIRDSSMSIMENTGLGMQYNFQFGTLSDLIATNDLEQGIFYSKNILSDNKFGEPIGTIVFQINLHQVMQRAALPELTYCILSNDAGDTLLWDDNGIYDLAAMRLAYMNKTASGKLPGENGVYYWVYPSSLSHYNMIVGVASVVLYRRQVISMVIAEAVILLICAIIFFAYVAALNRDYKRTHKMLAVMQSAPEKLITLKKEDRDLPFIDLTGLRSEYLLIAKAYNEMVKDLKLHIDREYIYKIEQQQAEIKTLQMQIDPHFLYNTLEIIRAEAVQADERRIATLISSLGKLYRTFTYLDYTVSFREEIELLSAYLNLMNVRYEDRFFYQIDFDPEILDLKTVKFWMQPLAENFFKHGFQKNSDTNLLIFSGRLEGDKAIIECNDNGKGMKEADIRYLNQAIRAGMSDSDSIGLANVASRLHNYYGESEAMRVFSNEMEGLTIRIEFTVREEAVSNGKADAGR